MRRRGMIAVLAVGLVGAFAYWGLRDTARAPEQGTATRGASTPAPTYHRPQPSPLPDATIAVAGRVLHDGEPVAGAEVTATGSLVDRASTTSDSSGYFELRARVKTSLLVTARAGPLRAVPVALDLASRADRSRAGTLELALVGCDTWLSGVVRDAGGGVVQGARVERMRRLLSQHWAAADTALTDGDGRFRICAGAGRVVASAEGYASAVLPAAVPGTEYDVRLVPAIEVMGLVVDEADRPVADATVFLLDAFPPQAVRSRSDGRFRFADVAPGRYRLLAKAGDHESNLPAPVITLYEGSNRALVARVRFCGAPLVGRVVDGDAPVPGVVVLAGMSHRTATDDRGRFELPCAPRAVPVRVPGFDVLSPKRLPSTYDDLAELEIRVAPANEPAGLDAPAKPDPDLDVSRQLEGRVLDASGQVVSYAQVATAAGRTATDLDGRFRVITGEGPTKVWVVSADGRSWRGTLSPDDNPHEVRIEEPASLRGVILGAEPGWRVSVKSKDADFFSVVETVAGRFRANGLPAGTYQVDAWAPDGHRERVASNVALAPGQAVEVDAVVDDARGRGDLHGRAVFADSDAPAPNLACFARPAGAMAFTDEQGSFRLHSLPSGTSAIHCQGIVDGRVVRGDAAANIATGALTELTITISPQPPTTVD